MAAAATAAVAEMRVVICGGGIIGAACAYYLSRAGVTHITIVERASIACHASGKAGGFLARDWGGTFALQSFDLHAELGRVLEGTDYRPVETLSVSMGSGGGSVLPAWADRCGVAPDHHGHNCAGPPTEADRGPGRGGEAARRARPDRRGGGRAGADGDN